MQRITRGKLKPIIIVYCCLFMTIINCDNKQSLEENNSKHLVSDHQSHEANSESLLSNPLPASSNPGAKQPNEKQNGTDVKIVSENGSSDVKHRAQSITSKTLSSTNSKENVNSTSPTPRKPGTPEAMNNGALLRGASVFLGLSIVVTAYIIFRCARLNRNRTQMVRKYGVLAHRQDVEMRPLPLDDEDEDDTTVFDASEVAGIHEKQRRMT